MNTPDRLEQIQARAVVAKSTQISPLLFQVAHEDIPYLLGEVERLRVALRAIAGAGSTGDSQTDVEDAAWVASNALAPQAATREFDDR